MSVFQDLSLNKNNAQVISPLQQSAIHLYKARDYKKLQVVCAQLLKENSSDYFSIEMLYFCMKADSNAAGQEKCLEKMLRLNPNIQNLNDFAQFLFEQERYEEAINLIQENIASLSGQEEQSLEVTYRILGNLSLKLHDVEGAEAYYHASLRINNKNSLTYTNIASLYLSQGDLDKSREYYQQALSLSESNDKAWLGLAMIHLSTKDSQLFWANIKNALDLKPKDRKYLKFAATQALVDCEYDYIIEKIKMYLFDNPLDEEIISHLISLLFQAGNKQAAQINLKHLISINPKNKDIEKYKKIFEVASD